MSYRSRNGRDRDIKCCSASVKVHRTGRGKENHLNHEDRQSQYKFNKTRRMEQLVRSPEEVRNRIMKRDTGERSRRRETEAQGKPQRLRSPISFPGRSCFKSKLKPGEDLRIEINRLRSESSKLSISDKNASSRTPRERSIRSAVTVPKQRSEIRGMSSSSNKRVSESSYGEKSCSSTTERLLRNDFHNRNNLDRRGYGETRRERCNGPIYLRVLESCTSSASVNSSQTSNSTSNINPCNHSTPQAQNNEDDDLYEIPRKCPLSQKVIQELKSLKLEETDFPSTLPNQHQAEGQDSTGGIPDVTSADPKGSLQKAGPLQLADINETPSKADVLASIVCEELKLSGKVDAMRKALNLEIESMTDFREMLQLVSDKTDEFLGNVNVYEPTKKKKLRQDLVLFLQSSGTMSTAAVQGILDKAIPKDVLKSPILSMVQEHLQTK